MEASFQHVDGMATDLIVDVSIDPTLMMQQQQTVQNEEVDNNKANHVATSASPTLDAQQQPGGDSLSMGVDFAQQHHSDGSQSATMNATIESPLSSMWLMDSLTGEDTTTNAEHSQKLLNMSLDELIEQQNTQDHQHDHFQYGGVQDNAYHSYHHQYKGRRGPSGVNYSNGFVNGRNGRNTNPYYYHRNTNPYTQPHHLITPPPPPSPYQHPAASQLFNFSSNRPLVNPLRRQPFNAPTDSFSGYGPQRGNNRHLMTAAGALPPELLTRQSFQAASALRRARLCRAQPYESMAGPSVFGQQQLTREQIVSELLLQQQRTRKALVLAGVHPDTAELLAPGAGMNGPPHRRPKRKYEDPLVLAEQSALNESELIYPVMVEGPSSGGEIESPDDSLIIRFKGTDLLRVRKPRGELVLNSGGWRTLSTKLVLNKALKPLGIWVEEVPIEQATPSSMLSDPKMIENAQQQDQSSLTVNSTANHHSNNNNEWRVVDGKASFLATFVDGMIIGNIGTTGRAQLMARASVIAQNWKQVKSTVAAITTRRKFS